MDHIMIDIETLSTHTSRAIITQIGAVRFNSSGVMPAGDIDRFLVGVETTSQRHIGRRLDEDTMKWWENQELSPFLDHIIHPVHALTELTTFVDGCTRIWSNGIVFDIGNLNALYRDFKQTIPWPYNAAMDMRTLRRWLNCEKYEIAFPSHNAATDAFEQAEWVVRECGDHLDTLFRD